MYNIASSSFMKMDDQLQCTELCDTASQCAGPSSPLPSLLNVNDLVNESEQK